MPSCGKSQSPMNARSNRRSDRRLAHSLRFRTKRGSAAGMTSRPLHAKRTPHRRRLNATAATSLPLGLQGNCSAAQLMILSVTLGVSHISTSAISGGAMRQFREVAIRKRTRLFDDEFCKIDELMVSHQKLDGSMSADQRRLIFERGDSAAVLLFNT